MKLCRIPIFFILVVFVAARAVSGRSDFSDISTSLLPLFKLGDLPYNYTDATTSNEPPKQAGLYTLNSDSDSEPDDGPPSIPSRPSSPTPDEIWCKAKSRGMTLMKAMMMTENDARTFLGWPYVQSPWIGDMKTDLETWGYLDSDEFSQNSDEDCDFATKHGMASAFHNDFKVDPRSFGKGGPNRCFQVQHSDGPAIIRDQSNQLPLFNKQKYWVNGREYRVS
jgi:hypothetical protein